MGSEPYTPWHVNLLPFINMFSSPAIEKLDTMERYNSILKFRNIELSNAPLVYSLFIFYVCNVCKIL